MRRAVGWKITEALNTGGGRYAVRAASSVLMRVKGALLLLLLEVAGEMIRDSTAATTNHGNFRGHRTPSHDRFMAAALRSGRPCRRRGALSARAVDQSLNLDRPIGRSILLDIRFHL